MIKMRIVIGMLAGGVIGFLVGYFTRCTSGGCPLTGNPVISTMIGAVLGALITAGRTK